MGAELGGGDAAKSEPNVVPLCDILLVLLIIFMVVTPMIQKGANVQLPEASFTADQPEPGQMITIEVDKNGVIWLAERKFEEDLSKLPQRIMDLVEEKESHDDKGKVLLKADSEISYGKVCQIMDEIKYAEIETIGLVVDKVSR